MRLKPCTFTHDGINEITRPEYTQISLKSFVLCWSGYFVDSIKCLHVYGVNFMDEQPANIKLVSNASMYAQCKCQKFAWNPDEFDAVLLYLIFL